MTDSFRAGTIGGTFINIAYTLNLEDYLETVLLAALGAIVSFVLSYFLKVLFRKHFDE